MALQPPALPLRRLPVHQNEALKSVESDTDKIVNDKEIIRGVCLGGWLVMEPWITPSIFETINQQLPGFNGTYPIVDEWTFWKFGPEAEGIDIHEFITQHWNSWIKEEHLSTVAAAGITHLRIPVGYWLFDSRENEPWITGKNTFPNALDRLKLLANSWAKKNNLKILFDLHGAPGSQNGFDNSGMRGDIHILEGDNLNRTVEIVGKLSAWVRDNIDPSVVFGIEVLNEPNTFDSKVGKAVWPAMMNDFYPAAYNQVQNNSKLIQNIPVNANATLNPISTRILHSPSNPSTNSDISTILQVAFKPLSSFAGYMPESEGFQNVWLDDHNYQCFGDDFNGWALNGDGWSKHLTTSCNERTDYKNTPKKAFVGEFSLAVTDCTKWLLGIGKQPTLVRNNHTETCDYYTRPVDELPESYRQFLANFASVQMETFEQANGWFFWTLRTEQSPAWDFLVGLREGWIANPLSSRVAYPCGTSKKLSKKKLKGGR